MQSLSVTLLCALVISVECMHLPADTPHDEVPRNSTPCSIDPNGVCSSISVSENYSMQLDARHFYDSGEIRGNLFYPLFSVKHFIAIELIVYTCLCTFNIHVEYSERGLFCQAV